MANHGIPEVPTTFSIRERLFLAALRNNIIKILPSRVPPRDPTNLVVTPIAGGNYVQFSKSDGDNYAVYASNTPVLQDAVPHDIGNSAVYIDQVGDGGITRYYWVVAKKVGQQDSQPLGPKSGVTLGLAVTTTVPTPPPISDSPSNDIEGNVRYGSVYGGDYRVY